MDNNYSQIEKKTKDIYIAQHKNYSIDTSIFDRHLKAAQAPETYDLPPEFFSGVSVLDAGCGNTGYFQVAMMNLGAQKVACLDIGDDWIAPLQDVLDHYNFPKDSFEYFPGNATKLPFPDNTFDLSCSNGVLMHLETVDHARSALQELARVTKPGGAVYAHIGIDKPGIVDTHIVPALRNAYSDNEEFKNFIDNLNPKALVDDIENIYDRAAAYDTRLHIFAGYFAQYLTLDTTTFWQNMLQVPVQQGIKLSLDWGINTMQELGLTEIRRPPGTYWLRNDFRMLLAPLHYYLDKDVSRIFYGNGHVKLVARKPQI